MITAHHPAVVVGLALFALPNLAVGGTVGRPTPTWYAQNAPLIAFGVVLAVEPDPDGIDRACADVRPTRWLQGSSPCGSLRICYPTARHIELGPGPRVEVGEEVVFFASDASECEPVLADPYHSLVSPTNLGWTGASGAALPSFPEYKESVEWAVALIDEAPEQRNALARQMLDSDNPMVWPLLVLAVGSWRTEEAHRLPGAVDPNILVPALVVRLADPGGSFRGSAFYLLTVVNDAQGVRGRYINEVIDAALGLLAAPEAYNRTLAYSTAKRNTVRMTFLERPGCWLLDGSQNPACFVRTAGDEDFGYRPDAAEEERTAALERWRAWWAENRGKGHYDRSEAVIAAEVEQERTRPQRMAEHRRALGEALKMAIDVGRRTPESLTADQQESLLAAGWEVTPDGRVVATGTTDAEASETPDAAGPEADASDTEEEEAVDAPAEQRPKGCGGCAAAGDAPIGAVVTIAALVLLLSAGQRRRRP